MEIIVIGFFTLTGIGVVARVIWNKAAQNWKGDSINNQDGTGYLW